MRYWIFVQDPRFPQSVLLSAADDVYGLVSVQDQIPQAFVLYDKADNLPYPFYCPFESGDFLRYIKDVDALNENIDKLPGFPDFWTIEEDEE